MQNGTKVALNTITAIDG